MVTVVCSLYCKGQEKKTPKQPDKELSYPYPPWMHVFMSVYIHCRWATGWERVKTSVKAKITTSWLTFRSTFRGVDANKKMQNASNMKLEPFPLILHFVTADCNVVCHLTWWLILRCENVLFCCVLEVLAKVPVGYLTQHQSWGLGTQSNTYHWPLSSLSSSFMVNNIWTQWPKHMLSLWYLQIEL